MSTTEDGIGKDKLHIGPYKATRLWNDVIRTFRTGLPVGRHRRYMKTYEECFVASDAVDWLHEHLKENPNFGCQVTRSQTTALLQKFFKARIFQDVRGSKSSKDEFHDSNRLYRFTHPSPVKTGRGSNRAPLATRASANTMETNGFLSGPQSVKMLDMDKMKPVTCVPEDGLPECHLVAKDKLTTDEIEHVWKSLTLNRLQKVLQVSSIEELMDERVMDVKNVIHNMTQVNRNGVVTNIDRDDQLPSWVLSAMRCLAHWPDKVEPDLPDYPGFEKDVFKVIKDYFEGLKEPLLTCDLYEVFTNVVDAGENNGRVSRHALSNGSVDGAPGSMADFSSVENLMLNLTMQGCPTDRPDPRAADFHNPYMGKSCVDLYPMHNSRNGLQKQWTEHFQMSLDNMIDPPAGRLETSFGLCNDEPQTRIYRQQREPAGDYSYESATLPSQRQSLLERQSALLESQKFVSTINVYEDRDQMINCINSSSCAQKCYSMSDMYELEPFPQNGLQPKDKHGSWSTLASSTYSIDNYNRDLYGYTVVLASAPKSPGKGERPATSMEHLDAALRQRYFSNDFRVYSVPIPEDEPEPPPRPPPPYKSPPNYHSLYPKKGQQSESSMSVKSMSSSSFETAYSGQNSRDNSSTFHSVGTPESLDSAFVEDNQQFGSGTKLLAHKPPSGRRRLKSGPEVLVRDQDSSSVISTNSSSSGYYTPSSNVSHMNGVGGRRMAPVRRSVSLKRARSSPNLLSPRARCRVREGLQVCCLFLPPANRRKLHMLLRLMNKTANNTRLSLESGVSTRQLVLQTFWRSVVRCREEADLDEMMATRLVAFLMDNYLDIMKVPENLKLQIEERIAYLQRAKVTVEEYENQKLSQSQQALNELLETIVRDRNMNNKDKKRRLKQFQKNYPEIYAMRFPTSESEATLFPEKPRIKPPLLTRPLQRLMSIRL